MRRWVPEGKDRAPRAEKKGSTWTASSSESRPVAEVIQDGLRGVATAPSTIATRVGFRHEAKMLRYLLLCPLLAACSDDLGPIVLTTHGPSTAAPGETVRIHLEVTRDGAPVSAGVSFRAVGGGGVLEGMDTVTDGEAELVWTMGQLPIVNHLLIEVDGESATHSVDVATAGTLEVTARPEVDAFLTTSAIEGSTADLAFDRDGTLYMGVPGHLLTVGATVSTVATTGVALQRPLGLAFDHDDDLWIADGDADALLVLEGAAVREVASGDGDEPFESPNDVAVGPDGRVYMSDTCTGKVYAIDPTTGAVLDRISFDFVTEGGPNGLVVSEDNELWITTENTVLFCGDSGVGPTDSVAGLFRVPLTATGFGQRTTVAAEVGVFGDGLAFDTLGNLYVIFDTAKDFALEETIVYVLPAGATDLRRAFAATGKVWANVAFAGDGLFMSLLAVPPFTTSRGVEVVDAGIEGAPLPPVAP